MIHHLMSSCPPEPTSGLDSSIALEVMGSVRVLADQRRTCLCTIHSPSPEVFALFDSVVLLDQVSQLLMLKLHSH